MDSDSVRSNRFSYREVPVASFEVAERSALVSASQLFTGLSNSETTLVVEGARSRLFGRNEILFLQGHPFRSVMIVEQGCVKLTRLSANGSEVILELRGPRDTIDLPGPKFSNHTCAARALVPCKTLVWSWSSMEMLMATMPRLNQNICAILTRQLHDLQERYHELSAETAARRLACTLIRLCKQFGIPSDGGAKLSISRQELAQMTGTTLFTVSRLISKWGELGLILPLREAVLMLNPEGLDLLSSADPQGSEKPFPVF